MVTINPRMMRLAAQLFLMGAVLGTIGDFAHVRSGTLDYPVSYVWRLPFSPQPFWVPILMGFAGLSIGLWMRPGVRRRAPFRWAAPLVLIATYIASGFIPLASGGPRDLVLAAVALASWWFWDRSPAGFARAAGVAVAGSVVEIALIALGGFVYVSPNFFSIMSWIPWLYFTAGSTLGAFVYWYEERNLQPRAA